MTVAFSQKNASCDRFTGARRAAVRPLAAVRLVPPLAIVTVRGEVDMHTSGEFAAVLAIAEAALTPHIVIDLRPAEFFDSAGVAVLEDLVLRVAGTGRSIHVTGARPTVRSVLEITGFGPLLDEQAMPSLVASLPLVAV